MRKRLAPLLAVLAALVAPALIQAAPPDAPVVPAIQEKMLQCVKAGEVAGVVTLVADKQKILHLGAVGQADVAAGKAMDIDAIAWIASMSKPITAAAVMLMEDEGKLSLDDPISKYIPELRNLRTAEGKTHFVTIRQIMSHTSGMGEATPQEMAAAKTLADLIPVYASKSLKFDPGTKWVYCQSGINTAARIVEIVSGEPFDQFLVKHLFEPLGMKDTTFYLSEAQLPRLAKSYKKDADGKLVEVPVYLLQGKQPTDRDRYPAANGGLFSTAQDYLRFCQMIAGSGTIEGKQILKPYAIMQMTTICTGNLVTGFTPGNGWGVGWCVVREPQGPTALLSPGTHGHGGAYGTQAWIDPVKGRIYIMITQRANFPNADASDVRKAFQEAAAGIP